MSVATEGRQIKSNLSRNLKKLQILISKKILLGQFMCTLSGKTSPGKSEEFFSKFHHFSPTKIFPEKVFLNKVILMDWKIRQILRR